MREGVLVMRRSGFDSRGGSHHQPIRGPAEADRASRIGCRWIRSGRERPERMTAALGTGRVHQLDLAVDAG